MLDQLIKKLQNRPIPSLYPTAPWDAEMDRVLREISCAQLFAGLYQAALAECDSVDGGIELHRQLDLQGRWNPAYYVDACAQVHKGDYTSRQILERIQLHEIRLLLEHCLKQAVQ